MLTEQTKANYRVQLRRLWEIHKLMDETDERRPALQAQILKMCDKLGYDPDKLDILLYVSLRGRKKVNPDLSDLEAKRKSMKEDPSYWTPEAIEARFRQKQDTSLKSLNEMINLQADKEAQEHDEMLKRAFEEGVPLPKQGGDTNEGTKQATDPVGEAGGTVGQNKD